MSRNSTKKYRYTKIQYFFWLLSGAEISILVDCPTDYNRQAGIGFTIFMTTLLAFFSGSYAGYYFGDSYVSAVVFGIIWASLIFSIDRSMVVTLKKDPTKVKQNFWPAFLSRAVLAILIAFIISIPLELLIFKENIDLHIGKYKLQQVNSIQEIAKGVEGVASKQAKLSGDSLELTKVEQQLANGEPLGDPEYDRLKSDIQNKQKAFNSLSNRLNAANLEVNKAYNNIPTEFDQRSQTYLKNKSSQEWGIYENRLAKRRQARDNLNKFNKKEFDDLKKRQDEIIAGWVKEQKALQAKFKNSIDNTGTSIAQGLAKADQIKDDFQGKIEDKNGFVLRFMVLENLARPFDAKIPEGATIFMLLWLIRILFFTIEILPTIAKIATPIGSYDRAIYQKEKDLELELEQRTSGYLTQQKALREIEYEAEQQQIRERTEIENSLHKELLIEIANVQNKVARQKIEDFKNKHVTI